MMVMFLQKEVLGKLTRSIVSSFCSKPTYDKGRILRYWYRSTSIVVMAGCTPNFSKSFFVFQETKENFV